jgi:uncharacterized protein
MPSRLKIRVDDLIGHLERRRPIVGELPASLRLGDSTIDGIIDIEGSIIGTIDGVQAEFSLSAEASLVCVRCLTGWSETLVVEAEQHFSTVPDEDGYGIVGGEVDLSGPVLDEMALGMPAAPLCRPNCLGLCPICGTDLNTEPCDGHPEESDSPFAALKDLFET